MTEFNDEVKEVSYTATNQQTKEIRTCTIKIEFEGNKEREREREVADRQTNTPYYNY